MSFNWGDFNPEDEPEIGAVPKGDYRVILEVAEQKDTKAKDGMYLAITFKIIEGKYKNRKVWKNINLVNPNETAVEIGKRDLASLCRAVGVSKPKGPHDLLNKILIISAIESEYNDKPTNDVVAYKVSSSEAISTAEEEKSSPDDGKKPWEKG